MTPRELIEAANFRGETRFAEPMSKHTTLGIGGPAEAMVYPESVEELASFIGMAKREGVPVFILGNGSNLLVLDGGIPGLVINTGKLSWMELERGDAGSCQLHAGAGATLARLLAYCGEQGLSGLEFAAGIPGTLGGAVRMNAGTAKGEMKDVLTGVTLVSSDGHVSKVKPDSLKMKYRRTELPEGSVVAEASLALISWPKEEVKEKVAANIRTRKATQPMGVRSAGSTFKNPPGYSAWKLIDGCGLRGKSVGAAQVSLKHANFLINAGGATAKDFKALMDFVVNTVQRKLNITLEPEVKIVGIEG